MASDPLSVHPGWEPHRLREHRQRAGLSLERACGEVRAASRRAGLPVPGITPSMMWKHENGKVYPGQAYQKLYCATYGASEVTLGFRAPLPGDGTLIPVLPESGRDAADPASAATVTTLKEKAAMALQRSFRFSVYAGSGGISRELVEQMEAETRVLARRCLDEPAIEVFGDLVEMQGIAFDLTERSTNPGRKRIFYFLAGVVSGLLAGASEDLSDSRGVRAHARTAYLCAENARSDALRAWIRSLQMITAYWGGAQREVIRYAEMSSSLAETVSGPGAARLHAMEARAWAVLGNAAAAEAALNRAAEAREHVTTNEVDEVGGHLQYPQPRQMYHMVDTLSWLPVDPHRIESAAQEAVREYEIAQADEQSYVNEALSRIVLGNARIMRGELEGAEEAIDVVLELPPSRRAASIRASMQRLHSTLRGPQFTGSPLTINLQLCIEEFCRRGARG